MSQGVAIIFGLIIFSALWAELGFGAFIIAFIVALLLGLSNTGR